MDRTKPKDNSDSAGPSEATLLLERINAGDAAATKELLPLVYEQLRAVAGGYFRGQPADHTLQPTALVHEAYLKLLRAEATDWQSRAHFCAVAATAMRQILQDRARRRLAAKRGGGAQRASLDQLEAPSGQSMVDLLALDDALTKLAELDPKQARIVELRFFGGLNVDQVAHVMGLSVRTTEREWQHIRLWLRRELKPKTTA